MPPQTTEAQTSESNALSAVAARKAHHVQQPEMATGESDPCVQAHDSEGPGAAQTSESNALFAVAARKAQQPEPATGDSNPRIQVEDSEGPDTSTPDPLAKLSRRLTALLRIIVACLHMLWAWKVLIFVTLTLAATAFFVVPT